jgi:hypothetical protein
VVGFDLLRLPSAWLAAALAVEQIILLVQDDVAEFVGDGEAELVLLRELIVHAHRPASGLGFSQHHMPDDVPEVAKALDLQANAQRMLHPQIDRDRQRQPVETQCLDAPPANLVRLSLDLLPGVSPGNAHAAFPRYDFFRPSPVSLRACSIIRSHCSGVR